MADGDQKAGEHEEPAAARTRRWRPARLLAGAGAWIRNGRPPRMLARAGHLEYDRILFFSDAVFAIAITLLVVDLPVQIERTSGSGSAELHHAIPGIRGFGISFAVIGLFWVGHHGLFRFVTAFDRPLMLLNLLFLGIIAFLPFPTALLSSVSGNQAPPVVFYAACAGSAGLVETFSWLYATRPSVGLVAGISPETSRLFLLRTARTPAVFAVSIVIAQVSPRWAQYSWLGILVIALAINRYYGHHDPGDQPDLGPADTEAADPAAAA
jgi:uncharacterized membrane protein